MKIKRIRIAVVIDADGRWSAAGWSTETGETMPDAHMRYTAIDSSEGVCDDTMATVWVSADVPVPEPAPTVEVEGVVDGE